jgi:hypothetical protein
LIPEVSKEMYDFNMQVEQTGAKMDDIPTHYYENPETKEKHFYRDNSKYFLHVGMATPQKKLI